MTIVKTKTAAFSWDRVQRGDERDCWPWRGPINNHGYGDCVWQGKRSNASRAALESASGALPAGMQACHHCDNPICCNPSHLYAGSCADNVRDKMERGRFRGGFASGAAHPRLGAKLDEAGVRAIRARLAVGESQSSIARSLGMSSMQISKIARGVAWKEVA